MDLFNKLANFLRLNYSEIVKRFIRCHTTTDMPTRTNSVLVSVRTQLCQEGSLCSLYHILHIKIL